MRRVVLQIDTSLDGFVADTNGKTDWVTSDDEMNLDGLALLKSSDTILLGRIAYQEFARFWPFADFDPTSTLGQIALQLNRANKVVFSNTLKNVEWGRWNNAAVLGGNVAKDVQAMKAMQGKDMLLYAGAEIVSTFIQLHLIDEYRLRVHPVVLGSGKPIFAGVEDRIPLRLKGTKSYANGAVLLNYQ